MYNQTCSAIAIFISYENDELVSTWYWGDILKIYKKCQPLESKKKLVFCFWQQVYLPSFVYPYIFFYIYFLSEEVNGSERSNKN